MGGNSSKSSVQQTNEFFNQTTQKFMTSLTQNVSATGRTKQIIAASGLKSNGCRINFSQGTSTTLNSQGQLQSKDTAQLISTLSNSANTAIDNSSTQKNGFIAPAVANSAQASTNLKNVVTNIISSTVSSKTVQDIIARGVSNQSIDVTGMEATCDPKYRLPGEYDFVFDQNITQNITAKGIADVVTNALFQDSTVNSAVTDVKQSASQENKGADDFVTALGNALAGIIGAVTGPMGAAYIASAILSCICCLALLYFLLSPAGQKATTNLSAAGAQSIKTMPIK